MHFKCASPNIVYQNWGTLAAVLVLGGAGGQLVLPTVSHVDLVIICY